MGKYCPHNISTNHFLILFLHIIAIYFALESGASPIEQRSRLPIKNNHKFDSNSKHIAASLLTLLKDADNPTGSKLGPVSDQQDKKLDDIDYDSAAELLSDEQSDDSHSSQLSDEEDLVRDAKDVLEDFYEYYDDEVDDKEYIEMISKSRKNGKNT